MHINISLVAVLVGGFSSTAAAAAKGGPVKPGRCTVPEVYFNSLPETFTLSALVATPSRSYRKSAEIDWPVLLSYPFSNEETTGVPIISRTKRAQPQFKLVNSTLVTAVGEFPAELQPTILIFPPPLQGFAFGGPDSDPVAARFGAVYACDASGQRILKLVSGGVAQGFAVNKLSEGQRVLLKPSQFAGEAIDVVLRINGGQ